MLQCVPKTYALAQAAQRGGQSALEAEHAQFKHELEVLGPSFCPPICMTSITLLYFTGIVWRLRQTCLC